MKTPELPRIRSLLFAPGNQERKLQRVFEFGADAVDLDLEDSVPLAEKETARRMVRETVHRRVGQPGPLIMVRVNGPDTGLTEADLEAAVQPGVFAIHMTKVGSAENIRRFDPVIGRLEAERNIPVGSIRLISSVDSAHLVVTLPELARSSSRMYCVILGGADFANDIGLGVSTNMVESLWARSYGVLVSRAAGLAPPLHPCSFNLENMEELNQVLGTGRSLGFQGGVVLHPRQVEPTNRIFSPTEQEVEWAKTVVSQFQAAEARGTAALTIGGGEFVDYAMVKRAEAILRLVNK